MKTYKINNRIYKGEEQITLNFKVGLQNLQTVKQLWAKHYYSFEIKGDCEVANNHKAKEVEISGSVSGLVEILYTLGHNSYIFNKAYGFYSNKGINVLQAKLRPKYIFSRDNGYLQRYQVYKPGIGWKFVTNTPEKCEKQIASHGKIYRNYNQNFLNQYQISKLNNRF